MMKLVHDDHVEIVRIDLADAVGKGLNRSKDVVSRARALAADQPLTEPRLAQYELKDLLALTEDLVAVCDEEQGTNRPLFAQALVIEGRNPGLAGAGCRDHEVAVVSAQALRFEGLECDRLVRLGNDVDQQGKESAVVNSGIATLCRKRAVETLAVTPGRIILELRLLPVLFEGRREALDHLRVLGRAHAYVPFQAVDLCRMREIR